eukprot:COSAG02_NODE_4056_length_5846_cov_4.137115_5_plen_48_part_00
MGAVEVGAAVCAGCVVLLFFVVMVLAIADTNGRFVQWTKETFRPRHA